MSYYDEDGLREEKIYDETEDRLIVKTIYDNTATIEANKRARNGTPETGAYKTTNNGLVHAGRMDMGDIVRLINKGYNLLSADRDEVRRALLYVQNNEPWLLTIKGKPFAKKRVVW